MAEFPNYLNHILEKLKSKGEFILKVNERVETTEGKVRDAYRLVVETELYAMMRLVDDYKMGVCNILCSLSENALMRGSLYPIETIVGPTGAPGEFVEAKGASINFIR